MHGHMDVKCDHRSVSTSRPGRMCVCEHIATRIFRNFVTSWTIKLLERAEFPHEQLLLKNPYMEEFQRFILGLWSGQIEFPWLIQSSVGLNLQKCGFKYCVLGEDEMNEWINVERNNV